MNLLFFATPLLLKRSPLILFKFRNKILRNEYNNDSAWLLKGVILSLSTFRIN